MRLKLVLPAALFLEQNVERLRAESTYGTFTVLPNHIDFATILVPGLLAYQPTGSSEQYVAVDEGICVKAGSQILVSTSNAVRCERLSELKQLVEEEFRRRSESERKARTALAHLESDFIRRYVEFQE